MFDPRAINPNHGSPADRGSADAYYYRSANPHKWVFYDDEKPWLFRKETNLTEEEIAAYMYAHENETERKEYC